MIAWWKSRAGKITLGILLLIVLGVFGFRAWLDSGIGRGVVETRLSAVMGRPVRLGEDLRIQFLPLPGATGSNLQIFSRDGQKSVLTAGEFLARLELWPLLRGNVEVVALRASDATLDIGVLQSEQASTDSEASGLSGVPSIQRFELIDTSVFFDGTGSEPYLRIAGLSLDGFRPGQQAKFDSRFGLVLKDASPVDLVVSGLLNLGTQGDLDVRLLDMAVDYENWQISGLKGQVTASGTESVLEGALQWSDGQQALGIKTRMAWDPVFEGEREGLMFETIELRIDGHAVEGQGCLLQGEIPQLNFSLSAPSMKLGDLKMIGEKWKSPTATPGDTGNSADELPFELGARLVIDQASYEDTLAEGVVLTIGPGPNCPDRL